MPMPANKRRQGEPNATMMATRPSSGRRRRKAEHVPHLLPRLHLLVLLPVLAAFLTLVLLLHGAPTRHGGRQPRRAARAFWVAAAFSCFPRKQLTQIRPTQVNGAVGAAAEGRRGQRKGRAAGRRLGGPLGERLMGADAPRRLGSSDPVAEEAATTATRTAETRDGGIRRSSSISTDTDKKDDDDDGHAEEKPPPPPPPRHLDVDDDGLDEFASALHEALRIAASSCAQGGGGGEAGEGGESDPQTEEEEEEAAAAAAAAFQALTIDFLDASSAPSSRKRRSPNDDAAPPPPPGPGSLKRITGRLVRGPDRNIKSSARPGRQQQGRGAKAYEYRLHVTYKYRGATDIVKNYPVETAAQTLKELLSWWRQRRMMTSIDDDEPDDEGVVPAAVSAIATEWGVARLVPATTTTATVKGRIDTAHSRHGLTLPAATASRGSPPPIWSFRPAAPAATTKKTKSGIVASTADLGHDRMKDRRVRIEDEFWRAVGVTTTASGVSPRSAAPARPAVKPDKIAKVKQCEKFVEIVAGLLQDVAAANGGGSGVDGTATAAQSSVRITDLGCGKGYLTYALHSYLQQQQLYANVTSIGVDLRPKLVQDLNEIVSTLDIDGLRFEQGSIQDACLSGADGHRAAAHNDTAASIQVAIALHACDTATDDALHVALQRNSDVIVTAPCCHKQLRPQINDLIVGGGSSCRPSSTNSHPHPLSDVLRHGIYRERTAETVTDSLRALLMELAGYETRVFEFVGGEHTAKNCMITGVRRRENDQGDSRSRDDRDAIRDRVRSLAAFYGVRAHKLADWMGEQALLLPQTHEGDTDSTARRSMRTMPPL